MLKILIFYLPVDGALRQIGKAVIESLCQAGIVETSMFADCISELIYTRTDAGKKRLLQAKMRSFSSAFKEQVARHDRWQ